MPESKKPVEQLARFIDKYTLEISSLARTILAKMRKRYPTAIELVYDNYNALAIGFGPTERPSEAIFSIALYPKWVSLFFLHARGLHDPGKILQGSGSVAKHIILPTPDALDDPAVRTLMQEAEARAAVPLDPSGVHRIIIKSVSARQRPRRPVRKARSAPRDPVRNARKN